MVGAAVPVSPDAGLGGGAAGHLGVRRDAYPESGRPGNCRAGEAKNTWFEILGQSLSVMARSIGSMLGREVTCEAGAERAPDAERDWASVSLTFGDTALAPSWWPSARNFWP